MAIATTMDDNRWKFLSDLDMTMPDSLVSFFLTYPLQPDDNVQGIMDGLRNGLEGAVKQLPPLAATIHFDSSKKPLREMSFNGLKLHVRMFDTGEHRSVAELAKRSFHPSEYDRWRLLPEHAFEESNEKPFCVAQVNCIPEGIILALGFNHVPTDMASIDLAISLICKCSKACLDGSSTPHSAFDYQRQLLATPPELLAIPRETLISQVPDYHIIDPEAIANGTKVLERQGVAKKGVIYGIGGPAVQALKDACMPLHGVAYISSYDCILAVLWRSVLRIRATLRPELNTRESRLLHPVNLRHRPGQGIPMNYFGNALSVASAGPVLVQELIGPEGLSVAASLIRQSIESTSTASIANVTALGAMMGPAEKLQYSPLGLLQENFLLTSWYSVDTAGWDFGIGPPSSVRSWDLPMPGCAILFPDCERRPDFRMYDLFVMLPEAEHAMLCRDEEMRKWFHVYEGQQ